MLFYTLTVVATCFIPEAEIESGKVVQPLEILLVKAEELPPDVKAEILQIDDEIKRIQDEQKRYLAGARRDEHDGMRWQFQQNNKQESRRAYERSDAKREAARMLQARIDALNARKTELLKNYPEHQIK